MSKQPIEVRVGLKFHSRTFAATAEIMRVHEKTDTIIVKIHSSDDNAYEMEWPLNATKEHFKQGFYWPTEPELNKVSIW